MQDSFEGAPRYCVDCGDEIGNGVRCSNCTCDCRKCSETFKTEGARNNHEHDGHCAACGMYLGDRPEAPPRRVSHREENVHDQDHFTLEEGLHYKHSVTGHTMAGGYLCNTCTKNDLTLA